MSESSSNSTAQNASLGKTDPAIHAIVPAGGAGTRLWPLSRSKKPKFLLDLTGAGRTLIQGTVARLEPVSDSITVVTGVAHREAVSQQLPQLGTEAIIAEPSPRDSMAAIGLAAAVIAQRYGRDAVVGSFAADQVIADESAFHAAVAEAAGLAREGWVATIGIEASGPSTAFGYIHCGQNLHVTGAPHGLGVLGFTEKPDTATAVEYLATGNYRWNAGMFVTQAGVLLDHLAHTKPELAAGITAIARAWDTPEREQVLNKHWPTLEKIAIDHAIAEPVAAAGGVAVVPAAMGWDDVGGFDALAELIPPRVSGPAAGSAVLTVQDGRDTSGAEQADVDAILSEGSLVVSGSGRKIVLLGVPGLVVVDTPDALLVTTAQQAQHIKGVVDQLKAEDATDLL